MKKGVLICMLAYFITLLASCSNKEEITLRFAFGERTGTYEDELVDGLPTGYGTFKSESADGTKWTYEGNWENYYQEKKEGFVL